MARSERFLKTFSDRKQKIGFGSQYRKGSEIGKSRRQGFFGVARASRLKGPARTTSDQDLKKFEKWIGARASKISKHSKGLSRRAEKKIMGQAEKDHYKEEGITKIDKEKLRQIVKALKANAQGQTDQAQLDAAVELTEPRERFGASQQMSSPDQINQEETGPAQLNIPISNLPELTYGDVSEADLAELQTEEIQPFQNQNRPIDEDFLLKVVGYKKIQQSDPDQFEKIKDDLKKLAQGGDPDGVRQFYPGWTNKDFKELLSRLDSAEIQPNQEETEEVKFAA